MQRVNAKYERIWYEREGWVEEGSEAIHDPPSQSFIQGGGKGGRVCAYRGVSVLAC